MRIPADAHIHQDRVLLVTSSGSARKRTSIGKVCGEGLMYPGNLYFRLYPEEWKRQYPNVKSPAPPAFLGAGVFALVLGCSQKNGLYPALVSSLGPERANAVMDLALYSLLPRGSLTKQTFLDMVEALQRYHLTFQGMLIDETLYSEELLQMLHDLGMNYVIRLPKDSSGFVQMMKLHGRSLEFRAAHLMRGGNRYGTLSRMKLNEGMDFESTIALIYDTTNAAKRREAFTVKVSETADMFNESGVEIPGKYRKYILFDEEGKAYLDTEKVQEKISSTGYRALGTSLPFTASEIDETYELGSSTEHLISRLKKGIGCKDEAGLENLIFTAFVSATVRWEIGRSCKKHHLQERKMIRKASRTGFRLMERDYEAEGPLSPEPVQILSDFDVDEEKFQSLTKLAGLRLKKVTEQKPRSFEA